MKAEKFSTASLFYQRVEKAMKYRGISTLKELAKKVKISQATIQGWKKEGSTPQRRTLQSLGETLNVPPSWLLGNDDTEPNWSAPAVVLKSMDGGSESQYMAECRQNGDVKTSRDADLIRGLMVSMRNAPPEIHKRLRSIIDDMLDKYQSWCAANYPSQRSLTKYDSKSCGEKKGIDHG
jgi:transcriptional regulator with XRE-family HTH domain